MKKKVTKKQLLDAINNLERNPTDKFRILGQLGITGLGAAAAGAAAAAVGVSSSIPVVTALTGYVLISATPVGWVAGAAAGGAAVAYGFSKLIQNGAEIEGRKKEVLYKMKEDLREIGRKEDVSQVSSDDKTNFYILLKLPLEMNWISSEDAQDLILGVEDGQILLSRAYQLIIAIIQSEGKQVNS